MSNLKESLKNKIKNRPGGSVHAQLIEEDVNVNVNVYKKKARKERFEERYIRHTHYIEKALLEKLNSAAGNEKGEKTRIINAALNDYLNKV